MIINNRETFAPLQIMGSPADTCHSDANFIYYIQVCNRFLGYAQEKIDNTSVYNEDDCIELIALSKEITTTQAVIEQAHNYLSGKWKPREKSLYEVFTGKLSQGK